MLYMHIFFSSVCCDYQCFSKPISNHEIIDLRYEYLNIIYVPYNSKIITSPRTLCISAKMSKFQDDYNNSGVVYI